MAAPLAIVTLERPELLLGILLWVLDNLLWDFVKFLVFTPLLLFLWYRMPVERQLRIVEALSLLSPRAASALEPFVGREDTDD